MWIFSQLFRRSYTKRHLRLSAGRGFTLIEMLVVMFIMMVITTALLINQSRFDSSTVLRSLAYGIALSVRQAQVYGTSVLGTSTAQVACGSGYYNTATGNCYASAYGLYFSAALSTASPSSYVLFADLNGDGVYQPNEFVKSFFLPKGYAITDICATEAGGSAPLDCWIGGTTAGLLTGSASVTMVFKRPNPDACFATNLSASCSPGGGGSVSYSKAYIKAASVADPANSKSVTITVPGEVSVCTTVGC